MEAVINTASLSTAVVNRTSINGVTLSKVDITPKGVNTNFRDASGRIIRTKDGLIFKARE